MRKGNVAGTWSIESDHGLLRMAVIHAKASDSGRVVDRRVLIASDVLPCGPLQRQELHIDCT